MLALVVLLSATAGAAERGHWLREHFTGEWLVGAGSWRTSVGVDPRAPGFEELSGGSELDVGFELGSGFGLLGYGRVLAGSGFLEGLAGVAVQLHVSDRVRLRAGPGAGELLLGDDHAVLVGGFLAGSVDLFVFGGGRIAATLGLRFDVDGLVGGGTELPDASLALALGVGLRY